MIDIETQVFHGPSSDLDNQIPAFYLQVTGASSVAVGVPEEFTARLTDAEGNLAPISATFMVPIQDASGAVVKVKGVTFTDGEATASVTFDTSGYYSITEAGINSRLGGTMVLLTSGFHVTCYE